MQKTLRRYVGNRAFYKMVLGFVIPIVIQMVITSFVNLLDNLMVGATGTEQMSGVAISNQLITVFNATVFGTVAGAGIFSAQFHGAGDDEGVRMCFRYKVLVCAAFFTLCALLFFFAGTPLIRLYLSDGEDPVRVQATLDYARTYLHISILGMLPQALTQCYASTLRETKEARVQLFAGILAVVVNTTFNYLLIFGKCGFPAWGVRGAAIATVFSRYVELAFIMIYVHGHSGHFRFARGLYRTLLVPMRVLRKIAKKSLTLFVNELLWSTSVTTLTQIYSMRGLDVVAAMNIASVAYTLFSSAFRAMGNVTGTIIGQHLGANETEEARKDSRKLIALAIAIAVVFGGLLIASSRWIPMLYNTTESVRSIAAGLLVVMACVMPLQTVGNEVYFMLCAGGRTEITFWFDCGYCWIVFVPTAFLLTKFCTGMGILSVYACAQLGYILKVIIGILLFRQGKWMHKVIDPGNSI